MGPCILQKSLKFMVSAHKKQTTGVALFKVVFTLARLKTDAV